MTRRLYLDEPQLAAIGFDQAMIATLRKLSEFVALVDRQTATAEDVEDAGASIVALQAAMTTAQGDIDDLEDGTTVIPTYVQKDQQTAPSFTPYAGQDVSAAYVEAEAQATDDAVAALASTVDDLITALQAADVLT